jgi:hypothetical protein
MTPIIRSRRARGRDGETGPGVESFTDILQSVPATCPAGRVKNFQSSAGAFPWIGLRHGNSKLK